MVTIVVLVTNDGETALSALPVTLAVDEEQLGEWKIEDALNPGMIRNFSLDWKATLGEHTLKAQADPLNDLAEPNEANNFGTYTLTVREKKAPFPWRALAAGLLAFALGVILGLWAAHAWPTPQTRAQRPARPRGEEKEPPSAG
jgi:hypothetical protein